MWLPIETAPKDGTVLLLWEGIDAFAVIGHRFGHWQEDTYYRQGGYWSNGVGRVVIATHWMPLPEPPAATLPRGRE